MNDAALFRTFWGLSFGGSLKNKDLKKVLRDRTVSFKTEFAFGNTENLAAATSTEKVGSSFSIKACGIRILGVTKR